VAYDSYYRKDKLENREETEKKEQPINISLEAPLTFWIGLLVLAALIQFVAIPIANARGHTALNPYFNEFADYIIFIPGILVLPLITAVWIGERVSYIKKNNSFRVYKGVINAIYASLVYMISILVIYIIMTEQHIGVLSSMTPLMFAEYLIAIPVVICVIVVPLFAVLSAERRYG
jgi:hypothetical protein